MTEDKEKLYENYGWLICDFDGEPSECETCGEECNPTSYRRISYEVDEGEYSCGPCIEKEIEALKIWEEEFEESKKYE